MDLRELLISSKSQYWVIKNTIDTQKQKSNRKHDWILALISYKASESMSPLIKVCTQTHIFIEH